MLNEAFYMLNVGDPKEIFPSSEMMHAMIELLQAHGELLRYDQS